MPAFEEEAHIAACIDGILSQDYPRARLRVLIVDAGSSDGTVAIATEKAAADGRVRVITGNGRLTTPEALNVGLGAAEAEVFARVDAHGRPAPDYVSRAVDALEQGGKRVVGVGGQPEYNGDAPFARAFTLARGSRFGVGGSVYAAEGSREIVDTVPWGIYWRTALERVGGFDPAMNHGEDEELNWRIKQAGMQVMLDSAIRFEYQPRQSLWGAFRQYRDYGRARARVVATHPDFLRLRHLAPAGLVLAVCGLLVVSPFSAVARAALAGMLAVYATAMCAAAVAATGRGRFFLTLRVASCFPALHVGYGTGTIVGFLAELKIWASRGRYQSRRSQPLC